MNASRNACVLLAIVFLCLPAISYAEPKNPKTKIIITKPKRPLTVLEADQARLTLDKIAGGASVISEEAWQHHRAATIKDMLDYAPGVFTQPRNGAEASRLSIRGSGLTRTFQGRGTLLMQDGIPINTADGSFDLQEIDPWLIRYAEIFRGANALQYGASTLGGAINFVTPTGYNAPVLTLRAEAGSFGTLHGLLSSGRQKESFDGYATATDFHQDGFRKQNEQNSARFAGNAGWRIAPDLESRFYLNATDTHGEIPGTLTRAQFSRDPTQANSANVRGDFSRNLQIFTLANKTAWEGDGQSLSMLLYGKHRELENPATTYIASNNAEWGTQIRYVREAEKAAWSVGGNLYYGHIDEARYANNGGSRGALVVVRDEMALTAESYAQLDYLLQKRLHGIAGMQVAYATRNIEEEFPVSREQNKSYSGFNPRLGLRYEITPTIDLFGNISRSFEPPTLSEVSGGNDPGFSQLDAQTATTAEIGTRGAWQDWGWEISLYRAWLNNEFINFRFEDGSTSTINADCTLHDGIELGLTKTLALDLLTGNDRLSVKAAYTWSSFKLDDDPAFADNQLPGAPEHYLRTALTYALPSGFEISPNLEWVAQGYPIDMANTVSTPGYAIYGLILGYAPSQSNMSFYLEGRNLTDKNYIATTNVIPNAFGRDTSQYYPGEGRALYAGLKLHW